MALTTARAGKREHPLPAFNTVHRADAIALLSEIPGGNLFDVVIADPPYNIGKKFDDYEDNLSLAEYVDWSAKWIDECLRLAKVSAPVYVYGYPEVLAHISVHHPLENQRWLVWHYTNKTVPSSKFWQRSHESILCLWKGKKPTINVDDIREEYTPTFLNNAAGKVRKETYCRYSSKGRKTIYEAHPNGALPRDVIKVPALAGGAGYSERWFYCKKCRRLCNPKENAAHSTHDIIKHPTQKPLALSEKLLLSTGGAALIPFAGSGAECVAAKRLGMEFLAAEINKDYVLLANAWLADTENKQPLLSCQ